MCRQKLGAELPQAARALDQPVAKGLVSVHGCRGRRCRTKAAPGWWSGRLASGPLQADLLVRLEAVRGERPLAELTGKESASPGRLLPLRGPILEERHVVAVRGRVRVRRPPPMELVVRFEAPHASRQLARLEQLPPLRGGALGLTLLEPPPAGLDVEFQGLLRQVPPATDVAMQRRVGRMLHEVGRRCVGTSSSPFGAHANTNEGQSGHAYLERALLVAASNVQSNAHCLGVEPHALQAPRSRTPRVAASGLLKDALQEAFVRESDVKGGAASSTTGAVVPLHGRAHRSRRAMLGTSARGQRALLTQRTGP
mmetsp:Transcript_19340/g.58137  ORF Transcript_19340/g.58137 Transcript_19340/m.58137 type:complete len:312 (+) Transcript_19340:1032-1967(+)